MRSSQLASLSAQQSCGTSFAWISALVGGVALRDDDLAPTMVLFFMLLTFLVIGGLRVYQGRRMTRILVIFVPTLCFVLCLDFWAALRADISNRSHASASLVRTREGLAELVAANGLVGCAPMMLTETSHQVFGLLAKRIDPAAKRWIRYTAYVARLLNLVALIMVVIATCDLASYLTAWLDQTRLAAVAAVAADAGWTCETSTLGRDLTLLPLIASGTQVVTLSVLIILLVCIRLRYRLAFGVMLHLTCIKLCLAFHYTWRCARDWSAVQLYLGGDWNHSSPSSIQTEGLQDLAHLLRRDAEDPTLLYLLGIVSLVLAMILVYMLNLTVYTDPPAVVAAAPSRTRFRLMLDPAAPKIELLPTKANAAASKDAGKGKGKGDAKSAAETLVVKRGWLGGWTVQPATNGPSWMDKAKMRARRNVRKWIMGWSHPTPTPA